MRELHVVPLFHAGAGPSEGLNVLTGSGRLVFPSLRPRSEPSADNTINAALRRLGFTGEEMVAHGFRSMASTCPQRAGWIPDLSSCSLRTRAQRDRGAYTGHNDCCQKRRRMMQAWEDYLVALKKARISQWVRAHPATVAPAGSNRSKVRGGDEAA